MTEQREAVKLPVFGKKEGRKEGNIFSPYFSTPAKKEKKNKEGPIEFIPVEKPSTIES